MIDPNIICRKCGKLEDEKIFCSYCGKNLRHGKHHLIPKYMDGTDSDGRIRLCGNHHNILHKVIESIIFKKFVPNSRKEECRQWAKEYSLRWRKRDK